MKLPWSVWVPMCTRSNRAGRAGCSVCSFEEPTGAPAPPDGDVAIHEAVRRTALGRRDSATLARCSASTGRSGAGSPGRRCFPMFDPAGAGRDSAVGNAAVQVIANRAQSRDRGGRRPSCCSRTYFRRAGVGLGHDHRRPGLTGRGEGMAAVATAWSPRLPGKLPGRDHRSASARHLFRCRARLRAAAPGPCLDLPVRRHCSGLAPYRSRPQWGRLRRAAPLAGGQGADVAFIRNVTDIDDKILTKAAEAGRPWWSGPPPTSGRSPPPTTHSGCCHRRPNHVQPGTSPRSWNSSSG